MSDAKGKTFQEKIANFILGQESYTPPTSVYLALFKDTLDDSKTDNSYNLSDEVGSGIGYTRIEYVNDSSNWTGTDGTRSNVNTIMFSAATDDWGNIKSIALLDDESGNSGANIMYYANLLSPKYIAVGDIALFNPNDIIVIEK